MLHIFTFDFREVFEILPSTNEPTGKTTLIPLLNIRKIIKSNEFILFSIDVVFTPFASQDLTYMSEPIEGFLQGTIMIHRPKIVHEGFYKIVSKVIRDQSEEVLIDAKVVYIRARSESSFFFFSLFFGSF